MRRNFIKTSGFGLAGGIGLPPVYFGKKENNGKITVRPNFFSDGLALSPESYARLLVQLTEQQDFEADVYCLGKVVHDFEKKVAGALGMEAAIYMPTGTLANHIALRLHAPRRKKVLVQQQSHVYRDSGDALQHLSGIHLVPLAPEGITFTHAQVGEARSAASAEKVQTGVEAVSIETPVRRQHLRRFDFDEMKKISAYARQNGIGLHLDGARLFGEAAISNIPVKEYTALFDTVYISLYKYFNSIAGAILAGPAALIEGLHHERRMFGGGLRAAWENVVVADYFFDGFTERFLAAQNTGKIFFDNITASGQFRMEAFENGTNVYRLFLNNRITPSVFRKKIMEAGIGFPPFNKSENCFNIKINESLNGVDPSQLAEVFLRV